MVGLKGCHTSTNIKYEIETRFRFSSVQVLDGTRQFKSEPYIGIMNGSDLLVDSYQSNSEPFIAAMADPNLNCVIRSKY